MTDRAIGYRDRLLAEAALHLEAAAAPVHDEAADEAARNAGGSLEQRLVVRARGLDAGGKLDEGLHRVGGTITFMAFAGIIAGLVTGAAAARTALGHSDDGPVNFFWVMLSLLGVQVVLLLAWLAVMIVRPRALAGGSLGGVAMALGQRLAARLHRGPAQLAAIRAIATAWAGSPIGKWTLSSLSHAIWVAFNVGCAGMVIVLLGTQQYRFKWETTILTERTYVPMTELIAVAPRAVGFVVPDREQIEQSRWLGDGQGPGQGQDETPRGASEAWAGLLLGSLVVYGFGPRALLLGLCLGLRRRACRLYRLDTDQPGFERLHERVMPGRVSLGVVDADEGRPDARTPPASHGTPADGAPTGPPAIVAFETGPMGTTWPPPVAGAARTDLGFVDDRVSRDRVLERLRGVPARPRRTIVVCALTTTPDRGVRRFIEDLGASGGGPLGVLLTGGQELRERTAPDLVEQRVADWRLMARAAGLEDGSIVELDLDHATDESLGRLGPLIGRDAVPGDLGAPAGRLAAAFALILEHFDARTPEAQAELHRAIARLYRSEHGSWRTLLAAPAELSGDVAGKLRAGADRVTALLPEHLRLRPRWMAAGALAGAFGCVAAATLLSPVAIGALPIWAGIGAAIATFMPGRGGRRDGAATEPEGQLDDGAEVVRAAALFALLLELQGRDETTITRVLAGAVPQDAADAPIASPEDAARWLEETRHRFDVALARETRR